MTVTAWVENRPKYCFNRRSSDSGTLSSRSSVVRGVATCLSVTPKIYASFVDDSPKNACWSGARSWIGGLRGSGLHVVDSILPRGRHRYRRIDLPVARQRLQHRDHLRFGVGVEEAAGSWPGVGEAEAVGAQRDVAARNPGPDLLGHGAHPIRHG